MLILNIWHTTNLVWLLILNILYIYLFFVV